MSPNILRQKPNDALKNPSGAFKAGKPLAGLVIVTMPRSGAQPTAAVLYDDAARFARDLKSLMHLLHRLDGFALAEKRAVTVPLLKRMLDEERSTDTPLQ